MKNKLSDKRCPFCGVLCVVLISFCSGYSYGQAGNTFENPIVVGSFSSAFQYINSQNTINFSNDYAGRASNDVFYKFTLTIPMEITISHCGSMLNDTYLYLLDANIHACNEAKIHKHT
jgi:hypothetical protein